MRHTGPPGPTKYSGHVASRHLASFRPRPADQQNLFLLHESRWHPVPLPASCRWLVCFAALDLSRRLSSCLLETIHVRRRRRNSSDESTGFVSCNGIPVMMASASSDQVFSHGELCFPRRTPAQVVLVRSVSHAVN
ncbi:hypothetical protein LY76DRAFT_420525 [Colletotrichum caudatum]|nr:hypothetical protein LY76DRAFT_420525 [Colletotrichum caudatum]